MPVDAQQEPAVSKTKRSLSQLMLAFAAIALCFSVLVMSPDGRFFGFAVAALCGAVPIVIGPQDLRKYGALAALVGTAGIILLAGSGEGSAQRTKARISAVREVAIQYGEASAAHRSRSGAWPANLTPPHVPKKPRTVSSIDLRPDGAITFVLSFPPVKDGALVFTPSGTTAPVSWSCRGKGVPAALLPAGCRE